MHANMFTLTDRIDKDSITRAKNHILCFKWFTASLADHYHIFKSLNLKVKF